MREPYMHPDDPWYWSNHPDIEVAPGVRWAFRRVGAELHAVPELEPEGDPILIASMENAGRPWSYILVRSANGREARIDHLAEGFTAWETPIQTRVDLPGVETLEAAFAEWVRLRFAPRMLADSQC